MTTVTAPVARLTVSGSGAEREREALATWLRGNPVLGRGWPVSVVGPAPGPGHMGGAALDALEVVLAGGVGLAQLVFAVLTWRQGRVDAGRHGVGICLDCGGTRLQIGDSPEAGPRQPDGE